MLKVLKRFYCANGYLYHLMTNYLPFPCTGLLQIHIFVRKHQTFMSLNNVLNGKSIFFLNYDKYLFLLILIFSFCMSKAICIWCTLQLFLPNICHAIWYCTFTFSFSKIGLSPLSVNDTDFLFSSVVQYFLSPILVAHSFIAALLSNLLFMVTLSYYHYLNFLGYDGEEDSKVLNSWLSELL